MQQLVKLLQQLFKLLQRWSALRGERARACRGRRVAAVQRKISSRVRACVRAPARPSACNWLCVCVRVCGLVCARAIVCVRACACVGADALSQTRSYMPASVCVRARVFTRTRPCRRVSQPSRAPRALAPLCTAGTPCRRRRAAFAAANDKNNHNNYAKNKNNNKSRGKPRAAFAAAAVARAAEQRMVRVSACAG